MKKLILSAALALACFTAHANNEVIKNDDDKNPKAKAKVVKAKVEAPRPAYPCAEFSMLGCDGTVYGAYECASTYRAAFIIAWFKVMQSAAC